MPNASADIDQGRSGQAQPPQPAPAKDESNKPSVDAKDDGGILKSALTVLSDQWFLIAIGIVIAIASQVQVPQSQQDLKRTIILYTGVSIVFLITGCTLDTRILIQNYSRWKVHLFVQVQCFMVCSAIAFGVVSATATNKHFMDPGLLVGMIFFSCVATTMSSNVVMTRQAHGNQALTVVQTTIGNFIGVFISPALVIMYTSTDAWYNDVLPPNTGRFQEIYARVLKQLGLSIYLPLAVGQAIRWFFPKACKKVFMDWKLVKLNSLCMITIIWQTYDQAFASHAFDSVPSSNMIFVVFVCLGLFLVYFLVAFLTAMLWLPKKDVVAVCYTVPAKGPAMGVPLSTTIFAGMDLALQSKIQIPIVIFQGLQIAGGSIMIAVFRRWMAAEEARMRVEKTSNPMDVETAVEAQEPEAERNECIEPKS